MTTFIKLLPSIIWFLLYPFSFIYFAFYNLKRQQLLSFFKKFKQLEEKLNLNIDDNFASTLKLSNFILIFYSFLTCICLLAFWQMIITSPPSTSIFLTQYLIIYGQLAADILSVSIHATGIFIVCVVNCLCDFVPGLIFHCIGKALFSLDQELKDCFDALLLRSADVSMISNPITDFPSSFCTRLREIWFKYETVNDLVEKVNHIYGALIFVDHGIKFFMTCSLSYLVLHGLKESNHDIVTLALVFAFTIRFITSILLSSHLEISSSNLAGRISSYLGNYNNLLSQQERKIVSLFANRLQKHALAACPLNLYNINSSIY